MINSLKTAFGVLIILPAADRLGDREQLLATGSYMPLIDHNLKPHLGNDVSAER